MVRHGVLLGLLTLPACTLDSKGTPSHDGGGSSSTGGGTTTDPSGGPGGTTAGPGSGSMSGSQGTSTPTSTGAGSGDTGAAAMPMRRLITFDVDPLSPALEGIPIAVILDANRIDYALAGKNGARLHFLGPDGMSMVPHEIERWDPAGTSVVWVRAPEIGVRQDSMWMVYGADPVASHASDVWSGDYAAVWHLEGDHAADSTDHGNDGGAMGGAAPDDGMLGGAWRFEGENSLLSVADDPSLDLVDAVTIEAWAQLDGDDQTISRYAVIKDGAYLLHLLAGFTLDPYMYVHIGGWLGVDLGTQLGTDWHHLVGTYDRSVGDLVIFLDGEPVASHDLAGMVGDTGIDTSDSPLRIGDGVIGRLDEVRVSGVARSRDWIAVQYSSMVDGLLKFGDPQPL